MTMLNAPSTAAAHFAEKPAKCKLVHSSWSLWVREGLDFGTTDHFGVPDAHRFVAPVAATAWVAHGTALAPSVAAEVKRLRDHVAQTIGLSRGEIARAIGVDRRSLSGYVAGEIRPTEPRLEALRLLAETASWAAAEFGGRAPELLGSSGERVTLLNQMAEGRTDIRRTIRAAAARIGLAGGSIVTTRARRTKPPLYLAAAAKWHSDARQPERRGVLREAAVYEQDLSQAHEGIAPAERPRRRGM